MLSILVKSNRNEVATETRKGSCAFLEGSFYLIQMITNGAHRLHILWPDQNPSAFPWSVFSPLLSSSHLLTTLTYPFLQCVSKPCHVAPLLPCTRDKNLLCDTSMLNFIQSSPALCPLAFGVFFFSACFPGKIYTYSISNSSSSQTFWHWGPVLGETSFPWMGGGMVWRWFKHITLIVLFISIIIASASPQIIRH